MGDDETGAEASSIEGKFEDPASEYLVDRLYSKRTLSAPVSHMPADPTVTQPLVKLVPLSNAACISRRLVRPRARVIPWTLTPSCTDSIPMVQRFDTHR